MLKGFFWPKRRREALAREGLRDYALRLIRSGS